MLSVLLGLLEEMEAVPGAVMDTVLRALVMAPAPGGSGKELVDPQAAASAQRCVRKCAGLPWHRCKGAPRDNAQGSAAGNVTLYSKLDDCYSEVGHTHAERHVRRLAARLLLPAREDRLRSAIQRHVISVLRGQGQAQGQQAAAGAARSKKAAGGGGPSDAINDAFTLLHGVSKLWCRAPFEGIWLPTAQRLRTAVVSGP